LFRNRIRRRAQLALTNSRALSLRGIKRGTRVRRLRSKLRGERRVRVGRNVWFLAGSKKARLLFKTRRGRVQEIGLGSKRLTSTRLRARRFLNAWRLR
jgi:hypothetical protein